MRKDPYQERARELCLAAGRWQLWMARLFGIRHDGTDGEHRAVGYYYKGKFYLWDYR